MNNSEQSAVPFIEVDSMSLATPGEATGPIEIVAINQNTKRVVDVLKTALLRHVMIVIDDLDSFVIRASDLENDVCASLSEERPITYGPVKTRKGKVRKW